MQTYPSTPSGPSVVASTTYTAPPVARPPSPMFVAVPPRTQRLVHSEAYLRYIETLSSEKPVDRIGKEGIAKASHTDFDYFYATFIFLNLPFS